MKSSQELAVVACMGVLNFAISVHLSAETCEGVSGECVGWDHTNPLVSGWCCNARMPKLIECTPGQDKTRQSSLNGDDCGDLKKIVNGGCNGPTQWAKCGGDAAYTYCETEECEG